MVFQMERTNKIKIHMLICLLFITLYLNPEEQYYTRQVYFQNLALIMEVVGRNFMVQTWLILLSVYTFLLP